MFHSKVIYKKAVSKGLCKESRLLGCGAGGDHDVTVSSIMSGLKTWSLGLNTLGTTKSSASSQSVHVSCKFLNVVVFVSQTLSVANLNAICMVLQSRRSKKGRKKGW